MEYRPIIDWITELYMAGFNSLIVVADFLWWKIAPLQHQTRGTSPYTGVNDATHLVQGAEGKLAKGALELLLQVLTGPLVNRSMHVLPIGVMALYSGWLAMFLALARMPMCDDANITVHQQGDETREVDIPDPRGSGETRTMEWLQIGHTDKEMDKIKEKVKGSAQDNQSKSQRRLHHADGSYVGESLTHGIVAPPKVSLVVVPNPSKRGIHVRARD
jgi:hypothetical protein